MNTVHHHHSSVCGICGVLSTPVDNFLARGRPGFAAASAASRSGRFNQRTRHGLIVRIFPSCTHSYMRLRDLPVRSTACFIVTQSSRKFFPLKHGRHGKRVLLGNVLTEHALHVDPVSVEPGRVVPEGDV